MGSSLPWLSDQVKRFRIASLLLVFTIGLSTVPTAQTPPPGMVGAYSLDEGSGLSTSDASGNNLIHSSSMRTWVGFSCISAIGTWCARCAYGSSVR